MPKDQTPSNANPCKPDHRYGLPQQLLSAIPGIPTTLAQAQATKIMDCARYLNHTGVMLGDPRRVAASYHLNVMVRALVDEIQK